MNRNSPVPLWAVLVVGMVLVGGIYVLGQRTIAVRQEMAITRRPASQPQTPIIPATVEPDVSSTPSVPGNSASPTMVPSVSAETTTTSRDLYDGIVEIGTSDQLNIPGKYQCGTYSVTLPEAETQQPYDPRLAYPADVFLEPSGKPILHPSQPPGYGPEYDATFSKDCGHLYYFDRNASDNRIHVLHILSGTQSTLAISTSAFPSALVLSSKESPNHPLLKFIYAIDGDHLLLWFYNPVSGPDWGINDTSQAVYTISTKKLTFLSQGEMDPTSLDKSGIPLLNYTTNTLIVFGNANAQGLVTTRTDIDLTTGSKSVNTLKRPGNPVKTQSPVHSCDYADFDTQGTEAGYILCRSIWLRQLLSN
jgi:hypothetical protein